MVYLDDLLKIFTDKEIYKDFSKEYNEEGNKAYSKLISLIYDIGELTEVDVNEIVERLDDIYDS